MRRLSRVLSTKLEVIYHYDEQGNVIQETDEEGNIVKRYRFDPFGNLEAQWGTEPNRYLFTGKEKDENGLYYFGARYYNPRLGRWITPEPRLYSTHPKLALNRKNPQGLNPYTYCFNNPLKYIDVEGKWEEPEHAKQFIEYARKYIGKPYGHPGLSWIHGEDPKALDCSAVVGICLRDMHREGVSTYLFEKWIILFGFATTPPGIEPGPGTYRLLQAAQKYPEEYGIKITDKPKEGDLIIVADPLGGHVEIITDIKNGYIKTVGAVSGKLQKVRETGLYDPWRSPFWRELGKGPPIFLTIMEKLEEKEQ